MLKGSSPFLLERLLTVEASKCCSVHGDLVAVVVVLSITSPLFTPVPPRFSSRSAIRELGGLMRARRGRTSHQRLDEEYS